MDAKQIRRLKPMLTRYLKQFHDCFTQRQTRAHFSTYVEGLPTMAFGPRSLRAVCRAV